MWVAALDRRAPPGLPGGPFRLAIRVVAAGTAGAAVAAGATCTGAARAGAAGQAWRSRVADRRAARSRRSLETAEQPARTGDTGAGRAERASQVVVVGHDQERCGTGRSGPHPFLVHQVDEQGVGAAPPGVPDGDAGRDLVATQAAIRRSVEHDLDGDVRWREGTQTPDQGARRRRCLVAGHQAEQIRPIDEHAGGADEWVEREAGHAAIVRVARKPVRSVA